MALSVYECQAAAQACGGAGVSRSSSSETWAACQTNQAATWDVARSAMPTMTLPAPYPRGGMANAARPRENLALCGFTTLRRHDRRSHHGQDRGALEAARLPVPVVRDL